MLLSATVAATVIFLALGRTSVRADQPSATYDPQSGPVGTIVTFTGSVGDGVLNNRPDDPAARTVRVDMWDMNHAPASYALTLGQVPYDASGHFEGQVAIPATLNQHQMPADTPPLQVTPGDYSLNFFPVDLGAAEGISNLLPFAVTASGASPVPAALAGTTEHDDGRTLGTGVMVGLGMAAAIGLGFAVLAGRRFVHRRRTSPA